jgi:hypothetical protein
MEAIAAYETIIPVSAQGDTRVNTDKRLFNPAEAHSPSHHADPFGLAITVLLDSI